MDVERGSIDVVSGDTNEVSIEIIPRRGDARDLENDYNISMDQSGNEVRVHIEARSRARNWFSWGNNGFELRARVPRRFDVDLKTSGGSIAVENLAGEVRAKTSGGSLKFGDIDGPVWGRTSGGSIRLAGGSGDADVQTSGGSITIGEVEGRVQAHTSGGSISIAGARGPVDASTSGGSIRVDEVIGSLRASTSGGSITASIAGQPQGDCELSTSGGNVTVHLARGVHLDLDAKASGRVSSDLPVELRGTISKREMHGTINGGGPQLRLRTSGQIRIKEMP